MNVRYFSYAVVGIVIAIVTASSIWILPALGIIEDNVSNFHLEVARHARTSILDALEQLSTTGRDAAFLISRDPSDSGSILAALVRNHPPIQKAVFINQEGLEEVKIIRGGSENQERLQDRSREPTFVIASAGQEYNSPVFFTPEGEPILDISFPVFNESGALAGVLAMEVNLSFMWDLMAQIRVGRSGKVYVVDKNKNLIADPNPALVLRGENLAFRPIVGKVVNGEVADGLACSCKKPIALNT